VNGQYFRRLDAPEEEPVEFELGVGDLRWKLTFPMSNYGLRGSYGEELWRGDELVLRAAAFDEGWTVGGERRPRDEVRCGARVLWDLERAPWMGLLDDLLSDVRVYKPYSLAQIQKHEPIALQNASYLAGNGRNLWSVLANWKASPRRYEQRYELVMRMARQAFPTLIREIEFDRGLPYIYTPKAIEAEQGLPPSRLADGLLTGLLHLTAIAGAKQGAILSFDEVENQLHPHAIRAIVDTMRGAVENWDLTIILTTHSPVVMNAFRDDPEQVYVLEQAPGKPSVPAAMTELHSEEWLAQAKLGTLYERLAFGAPTLDGAEP
jgi:hypothetical protein